MTEDLDVLEPIEALLNWSLYEAHPHERYTLGSRIKLKSRNFQIDAFCVKCSNILPFKTYRSTSSLTGRASSAPVFPNGIFNVTISCARCSLSYKYYFMVTDEEIMKIGQFPSIADISNAETAEYRKMMTQQDASEFYKAVGLAAHGVGIGSYAYLRRIFERLIYNCFETHKDAEGWVEEEFQKKENG